MNEPTCNKKNMLKVPLKPQMDENLIRYPPFIKGFPVLTIDELLSTQAELIEKIRNSLGFTFDEFNNLVLPVIKQYASFVHLLPASESHHHRGAGGLFRHGLEVAFIATQSSESILFSIEGTPQERRNNERIWRVATCFSGLLHDVGKPLSDISVTNRDGDVKWNPYFESLVDWATRYDVSRYFIRWRGNRHKRHEHFSLLTINRIIPDITRKFLSQSDPIIMEGMLESIAGISVNQPITKLMLQADHDSVARDLRQSQLNIDEFAYGVPIERYVFDGMRRLIKSEKWKVNEVGAKIWVIKQGVFIVWKQLEELFDLIREDKIPGIPRDPDTLADILIERGFAIPNNIEEKNTYYRYWEVSPKILSQNDNNIKILMLKLESPDLIFTTEPPLPVLAHIEGEPDTVSHNFDDLSRKFRESSQYPDIPQDKITYSIEIEKDRSRILNISKNLKEKEIKQEEHSYVDKNIEEEKDTVSQLMTLLDGYGQEVGELLKKIILPVLNEQKGLVKNLYMMDTRIGVVYPDGLERLGSPLDILSTFYKADVIDPDPIIPSRKIQDFNGVKVVVFKENLSKKLFSIIHDLNGILNADSVALPLTNGLNQYPHNGMDNKENITQSDVNPESENINKDPANLKNNNVSRPVKTDSKAPLSTNLTPEEAIQQLKKMIMNHSGRWLASPVIEKDNFLVTSDGALDLINKENTNINKYILAGILSRAQRYPVLKRQNGKLYLDIKKKENNDEL